jgi:RNA polymerase sigma factor (sigma-70 family)
MNDIDKLINKTSKETAIATATAVVLELKRQGLMKDNRQTPFQKTEQLLYNYTNFNDAINDKYEKIEEIKSEGLPKKSKGITSWGGNQTLDTSSESEKAEDKIKVIEDSIIITRKFIAIIDTALQKISDDPYFIIIRMKYFENRTREEIAEELEVDVSTITRNKNRLINTLKITLFSDEVIYELFS